jgi:hypothetical protein
VRNRSLVVAAMVAALGHTLVPVAGAQGALADEGAAFLLVPVGARAIGRGQAGASLRLGAEGMWWNPASIGWMTAREVDFHYSKLEFITSSAADFVQPLGLAGVVGASLLHFSLGGAQDATDSFGNIVGRLYPQAWVIAATYAAPFGERVSAGVTAKKVISEQVCSGSCAQQTVYSVSTYAFDAGIQVVADSAGRLTLGAMLKHLGIALQTIDDEQADPLPTRLHLAATYARPAFAKAIAGTMIELTSEIIVPPSKLTRGDLRLGIEARIADRVSLRAGIPTVRWGEEINGSGDGSNTVIGFGFRQGTLSFDISRAFLGTSAAASQPATYFSLRSIFR